MLESCKFPEGGPRDLPINEVLYVIVYGIIRHRPLHYVVSMAFSVPTCHDEVKPVFGHAGKTQLVQCWIRGVGEMGKPALPRKSHSPSYCLVPHHSAVETRPEVLRVPRTKDPRCPDHNLTAMAYGTTYRSIKCSCRFVHCFCIIPYFARGVAGIDEIDFSI